MTPVVFRKLELAEGKLVETEGPDAVRVRSNGATPGASAAPDAKTGSVFWLDVSDTAPEVLDLLRVSFGFHPLALEDCSHFDQRPKQESFGDYTFLVTQGFSCEGTVRHLKQHELHAFLGPNYLVTVHTGSIPSLERTFARLRSEPTPLGHGVDFVYYLLADGLVDEGFPILDQISDEIETLELEVLSNPKRDVLARVFELRRVLVTLRKVMTPQRDMMAMLARRGDARVSERTALYFRDVYDHLVRLSESIESNRDLLGNAVDAYLSSLSNRTNEVMKYLAVLSAVFLPLSFVVGFFGQNFENLPGVPAWTSSDALALGMLASCVAVPLGMLWWFRRKGWLE